VVRVLQSEAGWPAVEFGGKIVEKQEAPKAVGTGRIVDLRFGKVTANAQLQRIRYQETSFDPCLK
jgi:hypothetical protein